MDFDSFFHDRLDRLRADGNYRVFADLEKRCTGEATLAAIVDYLAKTFNAPRERINTDVTALLRGLADKKLLEL